MLGQWRRRVAYVQLQYDVAVLARANPRDASMTGEYRDPLDGDRAAEEPRAVTGRVREIRLNRRVGRGEGGPRATVGREVADATLTVGPEFQVTDYHFGVGQIPGGKPKLDALPRGLRIKVGRPCPTYPSARELRDLARPVLDG